MKNLILPLVFVVSFLGFSQTDAIKDIEVIKETKVQSVDVVVTVDNVEELETTFTIEDIREMFDLSEDNQSVSFKLVCNGEMMSNGKKSNMSYKVEGTSDDEEAFVKKVEAIRDAAIKYYKNKK